MLLALHIYDQFKQVSLPKWGGVCVMYGSYLISRLICQKKPSTFNKHAYISYDSLYNVIKQKTFVEN